MTVIEVEGVVGLRDVGGMPAGTGRVRTGRLFRSGALAGIDAEGAARISALARRIVDLRSIEEVAAAPTPIDGVPIIALPLYHGSPRSFFEQGYDLVGIYRHLLAESAPELVAAVRAIASGEPTLVHCTAGKDRTGLVIALALCAVGADRDAVIADYALTAALIPEAERRATSERLRRAYPDSPHAAVLATDSPAEAMRETLVALDRDHGSARAFLAAHGLADAELDALDAALRDSHALIDADPPATTDIGVNA
ncbi:tyrosine-protein phosphatase [Microbacterium azadirachtae]|uniref:Tyrosine-protein phosphatase n=1 Tax=Microbacterium azadirachtae TaxID=582680 RepID=A0A0F0LNI9_9MICO|nr:tyrosine-protein phosphatase [Microbacterium azadirachtae]KJL34782.1 Tyrosine-protein phosphatase precursor [Microbacterium azadirachtae]